MRITARLDKWLVAMWQVFNCKNGISSYEIARDLRGDAEVRMVNAASHSAVAQGMFPTDKLTGEVEADETFIGGKARNMHVSVLQRRITGTGSKDKAPVLGILERGGKVRTAVVPNRKQSSLQAKSAST